MFGMSQLKPNSIVEKIVINDFNIVLIRTKRRRVLSIEIDRGVIKARAPMKMRDHTIKKFILEKQNWIQQHLNNIPQAVKKLKMLAGEEVNFCGDVFSINPLNGSKKAIRINKNVIEIPYLQSNLTDQETIRNKLIRWYKKQAESIFRDKAIFYSEQMKIPINDTKIKAREYKRRWGSCNHKRDLSFNWRLLMAPEDVIDYVVIHELAHIVEFNHSKEFWAIVEKQMPDWSQHQSWLADNGQSLYRL